MRKHIFSALILVAGATAAQERPSIDPFGGAQRGQQAGEPAGVEPFEETPVSPADLTKKERLTVRYFFLQTCPYCRRMHSDLVAWGQTLPEGIRFEPTPVITNSSMFGMARGYYTVLALNPRRLPIYVDTVYHAIQERNAPTDEIKLFRWAAEDAGVDPRQFTKVWNHEGLYHQMKQALDLTRQYEITETPVLVIGGRYKVSPRHTNGRLDPLLQVGSGLVSRVMEQEGLR